MAMKGNLGRVALKGDRGEMQDLCRHGIEPGIVDRPAVPDGLLDEGRRPCASVTGLVQRNDTIRVAGSILKLYRTRRRVAVPILQA